jgi:tellurite resistance protein
MSLSEQPTVGKEVPQRLPYMPITLFAQIMGLGGLAIAWDRLGEVIPGGELIGLVIAVLASLYFVFLLSSYLAKVVRHTEHVIEELNHPIRLNFFPTISISLLLLSVYWQEFAGVSLALWVLGASLHLIATLYVMSSWLHHGHYQINHINPGWFIPVVGNIIVPINGAYFGFTELSWFFFSIGIIYWLVLLTIVMNRLFVHEALPPKLTPMMFILLAPPSIGFVSYTLLTGELDVFARILYYAGLFIALLLTVNLSRFWKLPFFISSWAYSFPLAALTIATTRFAHLSGQPAIKTISVLFLIVLTLVIGWLVYKTILAAKAGRICVPEQ